MNIIPKNIVHIANLYEVSVIRDVENCGKNSGACSGNMIYLGEFNDPQIELMAFFHELGHHEANKLVKGRSYMSKLSCEGTAWELGLGIAANYGYKYENNHPAIIWARKQLRSYVDGEYDDTKI